MGFTAAAEGVYGTVMRAMPPLLVTDVPYFADSVAMSLRMTSASPPVARAGRPRCAAGSY
jgi:ABC-type arginine transport system permease subunit